MYKLCLKHPTTYMDEQINSSTASKRKARGFFDTTQENKENQENSQRCNSTVDQIDGFHIR